MQKVFLDIAMTKKYKKDTEEFFQKDGASLQKML
jgi:hypothetical protein